MGSGVLAVDSVRRLIRIGPYGLHMRKADSETSTSAEFSQSNPCVGIVRLIEVPQPMVIEIVATWVARIWMTLLPKAEAVEWSRQWDKVRSMHM